LWGPKVEKGKGEGVVVLSMVPSAKKKKKKGP